MPKDDDGQVFDVSKPNKTSPDPTSRPIIVGHQPMNEDPMVNKGEHEAPMSGGHKVIPVSTDGDPPPAKEAKGDDVSPTLAPAMSLHPESVAANAPPAQTPPGDLHLTSVDELIGHEHKAGHHNGSHVHEHADHTGHVTEQNLHSAGSRSSKKALWLLIILLVVFVGAYLAIDSRLIKTSIKLPFHIFKQPAPAAQAPAVQTNTSTTTQSTGTSVPAGFTAYKIAGADMSFDYPTVWGVPAVTTDPGYATRSTSAKSTGTYAYLVNFATNKDVQVAITSNQFLPVSRSPLYYDYLQWCIGTNDGKLYKSIMHFTTTSGVDTPSTITCDQGPLADAAKLDSATIIQLKTTNPDGTVLGDLYTKNLTNTDLPVLRIKDSAMTNGTDIKKLLATVGDSSSAASADTAQ